MTPAEANAVAQRVIADRKRHHIPNEVRDRDEPAVMAFDYGYRQALVELEMALMYAFLTDHFFDKDATERAG